MQELVLAISDACVLAELDDMGLLNQLPSALRLSTTAAQLTTLRTACLALLSAAMQWDDFR